MDGCFPLVQRPRGQYISEHVCFVWSTCIDGIVGRCGEALESEIVRAVRKKMVWLHQPASQPGCFLVTSPLWYQCGWSRAPSPFYWPTDWSIGMMWWSDQQRNDQHQQWSGRMVDEWRWRRERRGCGIHRSLSSWREGGVWMWGFACSQ